MAINFEIDVLARKRAKQLAQQANAAVSAGVKVTVIDGEMCAEFCRKQMGVVTKTKAIMRKGGHNKAEARRSKERMAGFHAA